MKGYSALLVQTLEPPFPTRHFLSCVSRPNISSGHVAPEPCLGSACLGIDSTAGPVAGRFISDERRLGDMAAKIRKPEEQASCIERRGGDDTM